MRGTWTETQKLFASDVPAKRAVLRLLRALEGTTLIAGADLVMMKH